MFDSTDKNDQLQFLENGLAEQFKNFCNFLDGCIDTLKSSPAPTGITEDSVLVVSAFSEQVARLIAEIKSTGQIISTRQPELADAVLRDFEFLLAAWADEAMIKTLGQERLSMAQRGSIERGLFGTVHAGDEIFLKITRMLERRNMDDISLAAAYWLALVQGFEGRYLGGSGATELRRYARALQAIALQKILLPEISKAPKVETTHNTVNFLLRIGQSLRPKILLAFSLGLLLICLISLEVHWSESASHLTQTLQVMSDSL
jgi:type VI protein secretion system component VasF